MHAFHKEGVLKTTEPEPVKFGLKCQSGSTVVFLRSPEKFNVLSFQHEWALKKSDVLKMRGCFIRVTPGDATSKQQSQMHQGSLCTASAERYQRVSVGERQS